MAGEELIHGELIVRIDRCKNLYNGENLGVPIVGRVLAKCLCFKSDPYVNIKLGGAFWHSRTLCRYTFTCLRASSPPAHRKDALQCCVNSLCR
jgi:hypothetical protein